ncbi:mitochondrial 37S ribosomal protein nam9 [Tulasnella sp. 330]|nr:mitochondrial 37S ribosomal protein nam9 [Tulasnella sp. 330]KAG8881375.1 mitochondrial 37S ribosomal protein nam9 [Tulasnella sp. 331]KAG8887929.1 mitochondrial 37S ribosomal protein nam9 [Tulasnella sp. 332]
MRRTRYFDSYQALPRMSWNVRNLYNLWSRSMGRHADNALPSNITRFQASSHPLFKQRWQSKKLLRAYHCDYLPEKKFVRWWLPERLPDPMARKARGSKEAVEEGKVTPNAKKSSAAQWARNGTTSNATRGKEGSPTEGKAHLAPITSLMFAELERRIDVVVFRCCFAHSIHAARQLVVHGKVKLNGLKESDPNVRLNPGDMISVDPEAMTILRPPQQSDNILEEVEEELEAEAETEADLSTTSEDAEVASKPTTDSTSAKTESAETPSTPTDAGKAWKPYQSAASLKAAAKIDPSNPPFKLRPYAAPFIFIPPYIEISFPTCSAIYLRHPTARPGYSEIATPYDADGEIFRFAWEWYRKNSIRVRGWRTPIRERMEKGKSGWAGV